MALENEAWFVHGINQRYHTLAQQKQAKTLGTYRLEANVEGKTYPWNRIGAARLTPVARDADTTYLNPPQSKRRCQLVDRGGAVMIDDFDRIKTPVDIDGALFEVLVNAKNREMDAIAVTAALGVAITVDEAGETVGTQPLPGAQLIVDGGTGLTVAKVLRANEIFNQQNVPEDDRYFFYSAEGMTDLLQNTQVTSSDFNTIQALANGGFPADQKWMNFFWRMISGFLDAANTIPILPKVGNIRQCVAWQKMGLGVAMGMDKGPEIDKAPHKWSNRQMLLKLSMGAVRIDDTHVVSVAIDESV